jgi:hypothetical protein
MQGLRERGRVLISHKALRKGKSYPQDELNKVGAQVAPSLGEAKINTVAKGRSD